MNLEDRMREWFLGDEEAVRFALSLWDAAQEWDDLEDEGECSDPNALLCWLAFGKEADTFFVQCAATLRPVVLTMFLDWRAANVLERSGDPDEVAKAWMLRAGIYRVWHAMAWVIGGFDNAERWGPDIWRAYGETLAEFQKEMATSFSREDMACPVRH